MTFSMMPSGESSVSQSENAFPVVDSKPLRPLRGGIFRAAKRDHADLPVQPPGTALVFQLHDRFVTPTSSPLRMDSDLVVEAVAVMVVSLRLEMLSVIVELPSTQEGTAVLLRTTFKCRVTDPVLVLEAGCFQAHDVLAAHLLEDDTLCMLGARHDAVTNFDVSQRILARVQARNVAMPPVVPGLLATLAGVTLGIRSSRIPRQWPSSASSSAPRNGYEPNGVDGRPDMNDITSRDGYPPRAGAGVHTGNPQVSEEVGRDGYPRTY